MTRNVDMLVPKSTEEPILRLASPAAWDAWLATNHGSESGVHLAIGKKGGDGPALTYAEAVDVALAWGWIDGQKLKHDDDAFLQRFSRRRARSPWSKINREKAEALIRAGKMPAPGLAEVERAKKDGRWDAAYDSARTSTIPADLAAALAADEPAQAFFEQIDSANRYAILYRVQAAKKAETRQQGRIIPRCGGHLVGYFLPHEGTNDVAWGLIPSSVGADAAAVRRRLSGIAGGRRLDRLLRWRR